MVSHKTYSICDTHGIYCKTNDNMSTKYLFGNIDVQQVPLPLRTAFHAYYYVLKKYRVITAPGAYTEEGMDRWCMKAIASEQEELVALQEDTFNCCGCSYERVELATYKRDIINDLAGMLRLSNAIW